MLWCIVHPEMPLEGDHEIHQKESFDSLGLECVDCPDGEVVCMDILIEFDTSRCGRQVEAAKKVGLWRANQGIQRGGPAGTPGVPGNHRQVGQLSLFEEVRWGICDAIFL